MRKILILILIILISIILGGVYGILHDQISYSISEEYYTKFKFIQFGLENWGLGENIGTINSPEIILDNPRFGVAIVGLLATWWVCLIIGVCLALIGLIHTTAKEMFKTVMKAIVLTIIISLVIGFIGLLYGKLFINNIPVNWFSPDNLIDTESFIVVGSMHNFSYLGGLIGLILGVIFIIREKKKYN